MDNEFVIELEALHFPARVVLGIDDEEDDAMQNWLRNNTNNRDKVIIQIKKNEGIKD